MSAEVPARFTNQKEHTLWRDISRLFEDYTGDRNSFLEVAGDITGRLGSPLCVNAHDALVDEATKAVARLSDLPAFLHEHGQQLPSEIVDDILTGLRAALKIAEAVGDITGRLQGHGEDEIRRTLVGFCCADTNPLIHYLVFTATVEANASENSGQPAKPVDVEKLEDFAASILEWLALPLDKS